MKKLLAVIMFFIALPCMSDTIHWADMDWIIRNEDGQPGPNHWEKQNVWVDQSGNLHLIVKKDSNGRWSCAEIKTLSRFGFGTYTFTVDGPIGSIDRNVVLGIFLYPPSDVGADGTNEIDVEIAKWGIVNAPQVNYTVWPRSGTKDQRSSKNFRIPYDTNTGFFSFIWKNEDVFYQSSITDVYHIHGNVASQPQTLAINVWLFKGLPPGNAQPHEFIIRSLKVN